MFGCKLRVTKSQIRPREGMVRHRSPHERLFDQRYRLGTLMLVNQRRCKFFDKFDSHVLGRSKLQGPAKM